jgi:hypothetical protein
MLIGADNEFGAITFFFHGLIDEVRLYDKALSNADILSIYLSDLATGAISGSSLSASPANGGPVAGPKARPAGVSAQDDLQLLIPFDALRRLVNGEPLPAALLAEASLTEADRVAAVADINRILAAIQPRPIVTWRLRVLAGSFGTSCTVLEGAGQPGMVSLVDATGRSYRLTLGRELLPGTEINVTGYTDVAPGDCANAALEVISAAVTSVPVLVSPDSDSDQLPDTWERLFVGATDLRPDSDDDGDGVSNLDEFRAGTNPKDARDRPTTILPAPVLEISLLADLRVRLFWKWPVSPAVAKFRLLVADTVQGPYAASQASGNAVAGGYEITLPPAVERTKFFRLLVEP